MKHVLIILFSLLTYGLIAQKITKNEIDEFTNKKIIQTDWENLNKKLGFGRYPFYRFNKQGEVLYMDLRFSDRSISSILKGYPMSFKMDNDTVVMVFAKETAVPCKGCGSVGLTGTALQGLETYYFVNPANYDIFKNHLVSKVRIKTIDGNIDIDIIEDRAKIFQESIKLVLKDL